MVRKNWDVAVVVDDDLMDSINLPLNIGQNMVSNIWDVVDIVVVIVVFVVIVFVDVIFVVIFGPINLPKVWSK